MHQKLIAFVAVVGLLAGVGQATILVDFGEPELIEGQPNVTYNPTLDPGWNNVANEETLADAVDTTGASTGVSIAVAEFTTDGLGGEEASVLYPQTAQEDYVGCPDTVVGVVTLGGLTAPAYDIVIFGSRKSTAWGAPLFRKGEFTIGGVSQVQDHLGNVDQVLTFSNVVPVGGEIVVNCSGVPEYDAANDRWFGYCYLGVMEIIPIPEPATMSLLALGGMALLRRRR